MSEVVIDFPETSFSIRACEPADLSAVLVIENDSYPRPWSELQFRQELQAVYSRVDLMFLQDELAGYICYWLAAGEMHILNVAVASALRRQRVGHRLLAHVFEQARAVDTESACLEVRTGNIAAIALYRDFGFKDDGIRRAYYSDGEDALLMSCSLPSPLNFGVRA